MHLQDHGTVLFTISDEDKEESLALAKRFYNIGYTIVTTEGTGQYFAKNQLQVKIAAKIHQEVDETILDLIQGNGIQLVINTLTTGMGVINDGKVIRKAAIEQGIPLLTSLDTVAAILNVLESRNLMISPL
jgi:carbamoyl-phosphate synthase large subunit